MHVASQGLVESQKALLVDTHLLSQLYALPTWRLVFILG